MSSNTPEALHRAWADRFNAGDLDGLMTLYEADAIMIPEPGKVVSGLSAIRDVLAGFLSLKGRFELQFQLAHEAGGVALIFSRWILTASSDSGPIELKGQTSDVARRQPDGRLLMIVDNPFGAAAADAIQKT